LYPLCAPLTQGEKIGQIFAIRAIVCIGQFYLKITEVAKIFLWVFFPWKSIALILTLGYILGDFIAYSSGHPVLAQSIANLQNESLATSSCQRLRQFQQLSTLLYVKDVTNFENSFVLQKSRLFLLWNFFFLLR
jgi:hypothetical protein